MNKAVKAMILTVGGSTPPLISSLKKYRPQLVCFLASNESLDKIPEIKAAINTESGYVYRDVKFIVEDINDMTLCYEKILESCAFIEKSGISPMSVLADLTGGTKIMSAALTLASVAKGFELTYTGGDAREKNGLGIVVSGSERFFYQANPWQVLALEERRKAVQLFNRFQFHEAAVLFNAALEKNRRPELKHYLNALIKISGAYAEWDKFRHDTACHDLQRGGNDLKVYFDCTGDSQAGKLAEYISANLEFLDSFSRASAKFKVLCGYHIRDLLSNARRRASEGKYDDAVARLYRTLEMIAQERLKTGFGLEAGNVPLENEYTLKALLVLGESFKERHSGRKPGFLELSLHAAYDFLYALGDDLGRAFYMHKDETGRVLEARNNSILAHGTRVLEKNDFDKLWKLVLGFSGINESDLPAFPQINEPYV